MARSLVVEEIEQDLHAETEKKIVIDAGNGWLVRLDLCRAISR